MTSAQIARLTHLIGIPRQRITCNIDMERDERSGNVSYQVSGEWDGDFNLRGSASSARDMSLAPFADTGSMVVYVLGSIVHALTSITFGIGYVVIARVIGFKAGSLASVTIYVFGLWLAMLFTALPVAGEGVMGNKLGRFVWAEQFFLHFVYGTIFWWMLRLI